MVTEVSWRVLMYCNVKIHLGHSHIQLNGTLNQTIMAEKNFDTLPLGHCLSYKWREPSLFIADTK